MARVERAVDFHCPLQGDGRRQTGVGTEHPGARRTRGAGVEVDHLCDRMHAAVGAPRADRRDRVSGDEPYRLLYCVLDRCRMSLGLPAREVRAVIFDDGGNTARAGTSTGQGFDQALRFLFLAGGAFLHDFFENAARTLRIAHVHVGARQIEFGAHFAHGHRFEFGQGEFGALELGGADWVLVRAVD